MARVGETPKFDIRPLPSERKKAKMTKLALNRANKKILGVCAGLSDWTGIDSTIVRATFVIATLIGFGSPILIYIALGLILD
jgi:phage shock protein C